MTGLWSAVDSTLDKAAIVLPTWLGLSVLFAWFWSRMYRNRPRIVDIPSPEDAEFAAILAAVTAARDDIDRFDDIDLKADDYCEWLELRYQWMGSDQ